MGAFAEFYEAGLELGYGVLPIIPGKKIPGYLCGGEFKGLDDWPDRYPRHKPNSFELRIWSKGDTGLGVATGPASGGLTGIDIDTEDPTISQAIRGVLPGTWVGKRGARGETLFYYGPDITESRKWIVDGEVVCELLGPGRQTVLPPSKHPEGMFYDWTMGSLCCPADELPKIAGDIATKIDAVLTPFGWHPEPPRTSNGAGSADDATPHRQLNEAALANLSAWVPALNLAKVRRARGGYEAVATWRASSTGRELKQRKRNLSIQKNGIKDFGTEQTYTPLDLIMAALSCDLDAAFTFLAERVWPQAPEVQIELPSTVQSGHAEPSKLPAESKPTPGAASEPLEKYTHVPGLIGDIVDWTVATARRPNRVLALGAAITIVGTLIGRRVAGPTQSGTHLYIIMLGPSGAGKEHPQSCVKDLLTAVNALDHLGPSEFMSMSAVLNFLVRKPLAICVMDEFGPFLQRVMHKKASGHEVSITKILRSLWGVSFRPYVTPEWAEREMVTVQSPAISILGATTPDELHTILQGENIQNGFLNRFLVLETLHRIPEVEPAQLPRAVPKSTAAALKELYLWSGPESLLQIGDPNIAFKPDVLPWASSVARRRYAELGQAIEARIDRDPELNPYLARCAETAIRLATIRSAGRWGRGASVDLDDITWSAELAWAATYGLADRLQDFLPQNERSEMAAKIAGYIRRRGPVKVRQIQQFIKGRIKAPEIKAILGELVEAGDAIERGPDDTYRATPR